jgi:alkaline phosphatase D
VIPDLDRRSLLQAASFGLGALALPGNAAALLAARGFTHDVASGEPRQHSVLLWTRYVPAGGDSARIAWQVSPTTNFARVVASGEATAESEHDHTVKVIADGLAPGRWYYYRFRDRHGRISPIGRTRTLPDGPVKDFRLAFFSCSNIGFGYFNAYAHAAARPDIDLMVHLGDYTYEYDRGHYPGSDEAVRLREVVPPNETVTLADYRMRLAAYRSDPDLRLLHRRVPMIAMWDDHESANDSWEGGAQNHQSATEGPWSDRKAASARAYREWLPVNDQTWESYEIGDLATIFRPETRLTARSQQLELAAALKGQADLDAALVNFRDHAWLDPSRTMMGAEQERWLAEAFRQSTGRGARWQVLAGQTLMGALDSPPESAGWVRPDSSAEARRRIALSLAASKVGLPFNFDDWDGYPAARARLFKSALDANANLLVLSGDSHNAWGFDLDLGGTPVGVEFGGHSVTSPGYESSLPDVPPADLARAMIARNRQLKWANMSQRGYVTVHLTPTGATGEWLFMDTVRSRSIRLAGTSRMAAAHGAHRFSA